MTSLPSPPPSQTPLPSPLSLRFSWFPASLLVLLPLAADPGSWDILQTHHALWIAALGLFLPFLPPSRLPWKPLLLWLALFLPTWLRQTPVVLWLQPFSQGLAILVFWAFLRWQIASAGSALHLIRDRWLRASALGIGLVACLAILERFWPSAPWAGGWTPLVRATLGNPNHLASVLALGLPLLALLSGRWRWLLLPATFALIFAASRLALLAGIAAFVWTALRCLRLRDRPGYRRHAAWAFGLAACLFFGSLAFGPSKALTSLHQGYGGLPARLHLLRCSFPLLLDSLPWGLGYGRFGQNFPFYRGKCLPGTKFQNDPQHTHLLHLHNDWLQGLIEGGLPLLFFVGGWLFLALRRGLFERGDSSPPLPPPPAGSPRSLHPATPLLPLPLGLDASLGIAGLLMLGHFPLQIPAFVALSLVVLAVRLPAEASASLPPRSFLPDSVRLASFFLLWLALSYGTFRMYLSERALASSHHAIEEGRPTEAYSQALRSVAFFPAVHPLFHLAQMEVQKGDPLAALALFQRAFALLPDPDIALPWADLLLSLGRTQDARSLLKRTLQIRPAFPPALERLQRLPP